MNGKERRWGDGRQDGIFDEIEAERSRQDAKWGEQHHPDGTDKLKWAVEADVAKVKFEEYQRKHIEPTWQMILDEEVLEAYCEYSGSGTPRHADKLREELIQVAAVVVAWIEDIDSRKGV